MTQQDSADSHRLASSAVVVGVDGSAGSEAALRWAATYAARRGRALRIVHGLDLVGVSSVLGVYDITTPSVVDTIRAHGAAIIAGAAHTAREIEPALRISTHITEDTGAALLVEESATAYATVLGATGDIGTLTHLRSVLLAVTAHARGPVVVVRRDLRRHSVVHDSGPVVVGVDGGPLSDAALAAGFAEAAERRAPLVALHAWNDWSFGRYAGGESPMNAVDFDTIEDAVLAERLAGWQEKYPEVEVTRRVYFAGPAHHLREWSRTAQLVVVGTRGRGGFRGLLLGSTAHALVQHADCPVMVVHPR